MKFIFRIVWSILFSIIAIGLIWHLIQNPEYISTRLKYYKYYFYGFGIYTILGIFSFDYIRQNTRWFRVFTHELTHVIFSILTFNRIDSFNAESTDTGHVLYHGRSNWLISLSPYFFPVYTIILMLITPLFQHGLLKMMWVVIGFTYMFHIHTFWKDAGNYQTDLRKHTLLFSWIIIITLNILFFFIMLYYPGNGLGAFKLVFKRGIKMFSEFL